MILPGKAGFLQFSKCSVNIIILDRVRDHVLIGQLYLPAFVLEGQRPCFQADSCSSSAGDSFDTWK